MSKNRLIRMLSIVGVLALGLAACAPGTPEPAEPTELLEATDTSEPTEVANPTAMPESTERPTQEPMGVVPSVSVDDQEIEMGMVTVDEVVAVEPGWIVIHADQAGAPGPVIGQSAVEQGTNASVQVEVQAESVTDTLYAMLHADTGTEGEYEFPKGDPPVQYEGQVVVTAFSVQAEDGMAGQATVSVVDNDFEPEEITVDAGTTIIWTHQGSLTHTVTADDGSFNSGTMRSGASFQFTFEQPGTYPYYCTFHGAAGGSGMSGVVIVE